MYPENTATSPILLEKELPNLYITKEVLDIIDYLHDKVPRNTEWSGLLCFRTEGSLEDPANMHVFVEGFMPADIGTASLTEYAPGEHIADLLDAYPFMEDGGYLTGVMHTHHNMEAFFSATDLDDLRKNAPNYPFYLSVIVNYAKKVVAKIATVATDKVTIERQIKKSDGSVVTQHIEEVRTSLVAYNCKVVTNTKTIVPKAIEDKVVQLLNKPKKSQTSLYDWDYYTPKDKTQTGKNSLSKEDKRVMQAISKALTGNPSHDLVGLAKTTTLLVPKLSKTFIDTLAKELYNGTGKPTKEDKWFILSSCLDFFSGLQTNINPTLLEVEEKLDAAVTKLEQDAFPY